MKYTIWRKNPNLNPLTFIIGGGDNIGREKYYVDRDKDSATSAPGETDGKETIVFGDGCELNTLTGVTTCTEYAAFSLGSAIPVGTGAIEWDARSYFFDEFTDWGQGKTLRLYLLGPEPEEPFSCPSGKISALFATSDDEDDCPARQQEDDALPPSRLLLVVFLMSTMARRNSRSRSISASLSRPRPRMRSSTSKADR